MDDHDLPVIAVTPPFTRDSLRAYAEGSGDLNLLHLDDDFARSVGQPTVIVHGMLALSTLLQHTLEMQGPGALPCRVDVAFRRALPADRPLYVRARVAREQQTSTAVVRSLLVAGTDDGHEVYLEGEVDVAIPR